MKCNIEYYYVWIDRGGLESQVITYWNTRVIFIRVIIEVTSNVKYHIGKLLGVKRVAREAAYILLYSPFKSRIWKTGILPQWGIKLLLSGYWKYSSRVLFENKIQPIRKPAWTNCLPFLSFLFISNYLFQLKFKKKSAASYPDKNKIILIIIIILIKSKKQRTYIYKT